MCSLLKFVKLAIRAKYFLYMVGVKFKNVSLERWNLFLT